MMSESHKYPWPMNDIYMLNLYKKKISKKRIIYNKINIYIKKNF